MMRKKPPNSFRPETHFIFMDDNYWKSWASDKNIANCGHHIFGRGREEGCEKSPFNYAPLNNEQEHLPRHGYWMTDEGRKFLAEKTIERLSEIHYTLTKEDEEFLTKYDREYKRLKIKI